MVYLDKLVIVGNFILINKFELYLLYILQIFKKGQEWK